MSPASFEIQAGSATALTGVLAATEASIVLALIVGLVLIVFPRTSAATRSAVWLVTLIMAGAMPLAALAPPVRRHLFDAPGLLALPPGLVSPAIALAGAGIMLGLLRLARALRGLDSLRQATSPAPTALERRADRLRSLLGCRRGARIEATTRLSLPATLGLRDPVILVPSKLEGHLEPADLDLVLLHEIAHVRRRDDWSALIGRVVQAIGCFNPAVHFLARRLEHEREIACDDVVVLVLGQPRRYASCLTRLAEITGGARLFGLGLGALGDLDHLSRRIHMLVMPRRRRRLHASVPALLLLFGFAVAAGLPLARALPALRAVQDAPPQEVPPCHVAQEAPAQAPPTEERCAFEEDGWRVELTFSGAIELAPDEREIAALGEGAWLRLVARKGVARRTFEAARREDGAIVMLERGDDPGAELEEDDREWIGDVLEQAARQSLLGARARLQRYRSRGGLAAVLRHVQRVDDELLRRRHLELVLEDTADGAELAAIARKATQILEGENLVPVVAEIASRLPEDRQLTYELARVLRHVGNTSLRTRALVEVATRRPLGPDAARTVLGTACGSCSGCGQPELFVRLMDAFLGEPALRREYFTALRRIEDRVGLEQILHLVLDRDGLDAETLELLAGTCRHLSRSDAAAALLERVVAASAATEVLAAVIQASQHVENDTDRQRLLTAVLGRATLPPPLLETVIRQVPSLDSDHDKLALLEAALAPWPGPHLPRLLEVSRHLENPALRRDLLEALLAREDLDEHGLRRTLESVRELDSDHHRAGLLIQAAPRCGGSFVPLFLEATWALRSDVEKVRVLSVFLRLQRLEEGALQALLRTAETRVRSACSREALREAIESRLT